MTDKFKNWWSGLSQRERWLVGVDRNEARGAGKATIAIAAAKAPVLVDWLASLEGQGFVVDQLTITPAADGTIGLTAELRKGGQ